MFPIPIGSRILLEPFYDPDKIGSIYMVPSAQNIAPSSGRVVAIGPEQDEIEVGFLVLVSYAKFDERKHWKDSDWKQYLFYDDDQVAAFVTPDAEVYPRRESVIVKPTFEHVVERGGLITMPRVFESPPPRLGTVLRTGERVTTVKKGDTVVIPKSGGHELGVRDRVVYSIRETDIPGILTDAVTNDSTQSDSRRG